MFEKLKAFGFFQYGKVIPNLVLYGKPAPYPVLNERAVRAGAGLMFAVGGFAVFHGFYLADFTYLKVVVALFFVDFLMKVIVGIRFSPFAQLGELLVFNQEPEYVGAVQKRFAWSIGLVLSGVMVLLLHVFDVRGPINLSICSLCLVFMFLESSVGFCVGCKIYGWLLKAGIIKQPEYKPVCAGNVCGIE
jgi:hypothetical protein